MSVGVSLLSETTCPHCWEKFAPEDVLWVSEHRELIGDPKLGDDHQRRFLPSRFSPEGNALDERGRSCSNLSCPHCHLPIPRILLEVEPLFLSILGSPASGKSYFLASMTWTLRDALSTRFAVNLTDVDAGANALLNAMEGNLFLSGTPDDVVPLGDLIEKTQVMGDDNYDQVNYGGQTVRYPRPFLFGLRARGEHPAMAGGGAGMSRVLCLYDNAGESFKPDADRADAPVTRHMALSRVLFFVFDPTQDPRLQPHCKRGARSTGGAPVQRQEIVLNEAAARVRRYAGLPSDAKHNRPLIVVLAKCDEWQHLLQLPAPNDPSAVGRDGVHALDAEVIKTRSDANRKLMQKYCPEVVASAEDFSADVTYVAVSSLGDAIERHPTTGKLGIRPRNIRPVWVTVPMLYGLCKVDPRLIRRGRHQPSNSRR